MKQGSGEMVDNIEIDLIKQAKEGSNFALAQLLHKNYSIVFKFLVKMTLDTDLAKDISQDVMEKVIEKIHTYDENKSSFSTWMITIGKNMVKDEWKKRKSRNKYINEEYQVTMNIDEIEQLIQKDEILNALKELPYESRIPILLKHGQGYSYEEIAKIFGIPVGTVKSRIFNGLKKARKELENG